MRGHATGPHARVIQAPPRTQRASPAARCSVVLLLAVVDAIVGVYLLVYGIRRERPALQWIAVAVLVLGALLAVLHWLPSSTPPDRSDPGSSYLRQAAPMSSTAGA
jgi:drug/metabolite transporter (DMT)-like permease